MRNNPPSDSSKLKKKTVKKDAQPPSNVISFADHQKQQEQASTDAEPSMGTLTWLFCPTCNTIEYTEQLISTPRIHRVCGSQVEEQSVSLNLRAESTIAHINLSHLDALSEAIDGQRQKYTEYLNRLELATTEPLHPYSPDNQSCLSEISVVNQDQFGMLITEFMDRPENRFPNYQPSEDQPDQDLMASDDE